MNCYHSVNICWLFHRTLWCTLVLSALGSLDQRYWLEMVIKKIDIVPKLHHKSASLSHTFIVSETPTFLDFHLRSALGIVLWANKHVDLFRRCTRTVWVFRASRVIPAVFAQINGRKSGMSVVLHVRWLQVQWWWSSHTAPQWKSTRKDTNTQHKYI